MGLLNHVCYPNQLMFGQVQSFEAELPVPDLASKEGGPETFRGVFIRAPAILEVGPEVQVLADYPIPSNKVLDSNFGADALEVCYMFLGKLIFGLALILKQNLVCYPIVE